MISLLEIEVCGIGLISNEKCTDRFENPREYVKSLLNRHLDQYAETVSSENDLIFSIDVIVMLKSIGERDYET
jgi:hypothetical protein